MKYFPKLIGERIYLSPISMDDAETYAKWLNDPGVTDGLGCTAQVSTLGKQKKSLEERSVQDGYSFAIVRRADGTLIGNISFMKMDPPHRTTSCSIFIGEEENRGKGYGTEALKLLLQYGFESLNLNNIMLSVYSFNERGLACYQKVGFQIIGRRRQAYFLKGRYHDEIYLDILAEDYFRHANH